MRRKILRDAESLASTMASVEQRLNRLAGGHSFHWFTLALFRSCVEDLETMLTIE